MKIVYCLNQLNRIGGTERVTVMKANELAKLPGNEVYVIVANNEGDKIPFVLSPDVHFINMRIYDSTDWNHQLPAILNYLNYWRKKKHHKARYECLLKELSPDVVISTGGLEEHMIVTMSDRKWKLIREFHTEKNFFAKRSKSFTRKTMTKLFSLFEEQFTLKRYDRVVILSKGDLNENWSTWKNAVVLPNPVSFKCESPSTLTEKCVVSIGRLDHMKNYGSLINVFRVVSEKHPDWRLEIYGDGSEMPMLQEQVSRLGLQSVVFLKGFIGDVQAVLKKSSIFAFTSLSEGFGVSLVEAMECGLPVVSYDCPYGPREIITEGEDGYLIPVGDEQLMANRICELIENPEKLYRMGKCAKEKAQCYQVETIIQKWCDLFSELLQEGRCH